MSPHEKEEEQEDAMSCSSEYLALRSLLAPTSLQKFARGVNSCRGLSVAPQGYKLARSARRHYLRVEDIFSFMVSNINFSFY